MRARRRNQREGLTRALAGCADLLAVAMLFTLATGCSTSTGLDASTGLAADAQSESRPSGVSTNGGGAGNSGAPGTSAGLGAPPSGLGPGTLPPGPCTGPCCTPPALGSSCPSADDGTMCPGGNFCPGGLLFGWQVVCRGGTWQTFGEPCPRLDGGVTAQGCPAKQPMPGDPCMSAEGGVVPGVPVCPPGGPPASGGDAAVLCALPLVLSCQYVLECAPTTCDAGPAPPQPEGGTTTPVCATLASITASATCTDNRWETTPLPASCP
jgi:hypothetical protein